MFYDHALLTSREHGVATVWLAATLGAHSKKVNRKAISEVNIEKACGVIAEPDVPLALRLSGSLLFGISRVYFRKCDYVLIDAQAAQNNIKALWKIIGSRGLDPKAGKAKPEQLIVQDDPAFLPDDFIPTFDLDVFAFESTQASSHKTSSLSKGARTSSNSSLDSPSVLGLVIPASESDNVGGLHLPSSDPGSATRRRDPLMALGDEDGFDPHVGFEFDAEGNMFDLNALEDDKPTQRADTRLPTDSAMSSRVREEHEQARFIAQQALGDEMDIDFAIPPLGEEYRQLLPEAEAFPEMPTQRNEEILAPHTNGNTSEHVEMAPIRKKRFRALIPVDETLQIRNAELAFWNQNYVQNMAEARKLKTHGKIRSDAKKQAAFLVLGRGINGVGCGHGALHLPSPFTAYHGPGLYEMLTGKPGTTAEKERGPDSSPSESPSARRKRRFSDDEPPLFRTGPAPNDETTNDQFALFDDTIELARDADPLQFLEEHSSQMPWNQPSSRAGSRLGSVPGSAMRPGPSPSLGFGGSAAGGFAFNPASAASPSSPLRGEAPDPFPGRRSESSIAAFDTQAAPALPQHPHAFEMWGPAAAVDTQTAAASQWVREALETETQNFLAFVRRAVADADADVGADVQVWFADLLPPAAHTRVVATQAFMHLLSLAGRGLLRVSQEHPERFGGLRLGLAAAL